MARCKKCSADIEFKPHPQNPQKMAPFDLDGEIHFARCSGGREKKEYASIGELLCPKCEEMAFLVYLQPTAAGQRLAWMCDQYHKHFIPMTSGNLKLVNAEWRQVQMIDKVIHCRWMGDHESACWLIDQYAGTYGVARELKPLFRHFGYV